MQDVTSKILKYLLTYTEFSNIWNTLNSDTKSTLMSRWCEIISTMPTIGLFPAKCATSILEDMLGTQRFKHSVKSVAGHTELVSKIASIICEKT